jgi:mono/diheme cytochrome c family protein
MRRPLIPTRRMARFGLAWIGVLLATGLTPLEAGDGGVSMSGPSTFPQQDGQALFQAICQGCHMANAQGAVGAGAYPALAHNKKLATAAYPVYTVMRGRKDMPALSVYLSDAQVIAVVTYVRTHFGNHYPDKIPPELVKAAREAY